PSPHRSRRHVGEQPSHAMWLPSSHCSPGSTLPLPQTAVFGVQVSVTWFEVIRAPRPSRAAMVRVLDPARPAGCGPVMWTGAVRSLRCLIGVPATSTLVPALTVSPRGVMALTSVAAFALSTDVLEVSGFGFRMEIDATWIGLQLGSRASISSAQTATSNAQLPSIFPSSSPAGAPAMHRRALGREPPPPLPPEAL